MTGKEKKKTVEENMHVELQCAFSLPAVVTVVHIT